MPGHEDDSERGTHKIIVDKEALKKAFEKERKIIVKTPADFDEERLQRAKKEREAARG